MEVTEFFQKLFDTSDFPARWHCGKWSDFHGWLYIGSNLAIWASYFAIPLLMVKVIAQRKDLPFRKIFLLFVAFILFCGTTHFIDALIFWVPVYRFNALFLSGTAIVSWATAFYLYKVMPKAFALKTPTELERVVLEKTEELKEAYKKLEERERQFKALVNNNPDIIGHLGSDLKLKFINDSVKKISGKDSKHYIGKSLMDLEYPTKMKVNYSNVVEMAIRNKSIETYESEDWSPDQGREYFKISIVPIINGEQEVKDVLTVARNITPLKIAEFQLKEKISQLEVLSRNIENKKNRLESFAYIVSHNLRSPLATLEAIAELRKISTSEEEQKLYQQKSEELIAKLSQTVSDLTEIIKINLEQDVKKEVNNFEHVLLNLRDLLSVQLKESNAEIIADFSKCSSIYYPKAYLESILQNLITNAIKYRPNDRNPVIKLTTKATSKGVMLTCQDNGLGIDLEKYGDKIFQLHKTFHGNKDARGVGLFITRNQIESFGGEIKVESKVEEGTKFFIYFGEESIPKT
ncbi:sensor histidine kinase [Flexithrix dorotheae]|uniref:sensor histidine kinase n=1 Tax=Flexithrix dorotheae TaxID=70993 RepID=UPI00036824F0|nr:PAS domain-containing sensor histidine kinase [Flexithrix dorotheae]